MWFRKKKMDVAYQQLNSILAASFQNVRRETSRINQWLNFFYQRSLQQDQQIKMLNQHLQQIPKTPMEFKEIIDDIYHFEALEKRIQEVTQRIDAIYQQKPAAAPVVHIPNNKIAELQERLERIEAKKQSFKEKIIKKLAKSSKDYIKSMIVSYIKKYEKISAFQLKEMIVDEQKLCSKSSFYRLLDEIESEFEEISSIKQGKEKHYISKAVKHV